MRKRSNSVQCRILVAALSLAAAGNLHSGQAISQTLPDGLSVWWTFDEPREGRVLEHRSETYTAVQSLYHPPEWVEGVSGMAFRLNGYSTWLERELPDSLQPREALTVEAWVALNGLPVTDAPFVNQHHLPDAGYFFGMNNVGQAFLTVSIDGEEHTCRAESLLPMREWIHVAATFDSEPGEMNVFLDGETVCAKSVPARPMTVDSGTNVSVGRDARSGAISVFQTGLWNGMVDEVKVYHRALSQHEIRQNATALTPSAEADFAVPPSRFAGDLHRPRYFPLPPANWTNEPHGLVYFDGTYHMFYQRNPNGPYFAHLRWGHMTSPDLVRWEHQPIAISQEPGWDNHGIWSGDAVVHNDTLTAVYTGVDGIKAGIGIATWDPETRKFAKHEGNPVIPAAPEDVSEIRDPFVWQEDGEWHMIIGSGIDDAGGTAVHYTSADLRDWTYHGQIFTAEKEQAGIFWEMPILVPLGEDKHMLELTTVEEDAPARGLYWIGTWDGREFTPDHDQPRQLDLVNHLLSPTVTWTPEGEPVAIAIVPDTRDSRLAREAGWVHTFSIPRTWSLCDDGTLCQRPARQLQQLRGEHLRQENLQIGPDEESLSDVRGRSMEIKVTFEPVDAQEFGIEVLRAPDGSETTRIFYDAREETLNLDLRRSSLHPDVRNKRLHPVEYPLDEEGVLTLHIFLDHSIMEVFVNERDAFATRAYPVQTISNGVRLFARDGSATVRQIDVWQIETEDP